MSLIEAIIIIAPCIVIVTFLTRRYLTLLYHSSQQKFGEAGFRSRCLVVANDALYRLSYIPGYRHVQTI